MEEFSGRSLVEWYQMFLMSHNLTEGQFFQWTWPDGKPGNKQSNITMDMFKLIKSEAENQISKKIKQQMRSKNG